MTVDPELYEKWTVQLRKGVLELILLAALAEQPRYGFELIGTIRKKAELEMPEGTIYPLLLRLDKDGMIRADWAEGEGGARRKYYGLTPRGEAMLARMVTGWKKLSASVEAMTGEWA